MPIIGGATELVEKVRSLGVELWITTTRPYMRLDNIDPDTRFWLSSYNIEYDGLIYHQDKYLVLGEHVDEDRVAAILDDLPEMYDSATEAFGHTIPILIRNRYNGKIIRPNIAQDLTDAYKRIENNVYHWQARHTDASR